VDHAQAQEGEPSGSSHARRGMIIGAATGGALGGTAAGLLASAFCESNCDHAFRDGFALGFLAGAGLGGVAGMVIGSGLPAGSESGESETPDGWRLALASGPRWSGMDLGRDMSLWLAVAALRPTTRSIWWGLEAAYLGTGRRTREFTLQPPSGVPVTVTEKWRRTLLGFSMVAARSLGPGSPSSAYLLASAGAYPMVVNIRERRTPENTDGLVRPRPDMDFTEWYPGLGFGGGGHWHWTGGWRLGMDSRLHLVLGAGQDIVEPVLTVGFSAALER